MSTENKFKVLDDRSHILLRPELYIGSVRHVSSNEFILDNDKIVYKSVNYIPGLIKIINEIIDNSIDEAIRTKFKYSNKIKVNISDTEIIVEDNGRGIPVKKEETTGEYIPVLAWTRAKAGSNFDDAERTTIGQFGVGSVASNIMSKSFYGETSDGENRLSLECSDNAAKVEYKIHKNSQQYTLVKFTPDFKLFENMTKLDDLHKNIIYTRLLNLSMAYPQIQFIYNGKLIKFTSFAQYIKYYSDNCEILETPSLNFRIAVYANTSDDFNFVHFINGLNVYEGGNTLNWAVNTIVNGLREKIERKYKNIKPGDIKNKLSIIVFFNNMVNPRFNSQSKTFCSNTPGEFIDNLGTIDWDIFIKKIYKNTSIVDPIIEIFKIKEEFESRKQLKELQSTGSRSFYVEKYIAPIKENKYMIFCEGDSAVNSIQPVLGREYFGYLPLKGKPLNCFEVKLSRVIENVEIKSIIEILGLDLTKDKQIMNYENIVFATDADLDGISIRALLLTLFYRFCPDIIKAGKVKFLRTPLITAIKNKKIIDYFFNFDEYNTYLNKHKEHTNIEYHYYKGLGTWEAKDLKPLLIKDGLSNFIVDVNFDVDTDKLIREWMSKETSDIRKEYLKDKHFSIDFI